MIEIEDKNNPNKDPINQTPDGGDAQSINSGQSLHSTQNSQSNEQNKEKTISPLPDSTKMLDSNMPGPINIQIISNTSENINSSQKKVSGRKPQKFYCDACKTEQISKISHQIGSGSWTVFGFSLFFCPCFACLPFLLKNCQDLKHSCPTCGKEVGVIKFFAE